MRPQAFTKKLQSSPGTRKPHKMSSLRPHERATDMGHSLQPELFDGSSNSQQSWHSFMSLPDYSERSGLSIVNDGSLSTYNSSSQDTSSTSKFSGKVSTIAATGTDSHTNLGFKDYSAVFANTLGGTYSGISNGAATVTGPNASDTSSQTQQVPLPNMTSPERVNMSQLSPPQALQFDTSSSHGHALSASLGQSLDFLANPSLQQQLLLLQHQQQQQQQQQQRQQPFGELSSIFSKITADMSPHSSQTLSLGQPDQQQQEVHQVSLTTDQIKILLAALERMNSVQKQIHTPSEELPQQQQMIQQLTKEQQIYLQQLQRSHSQITSSTVGEDMDMALSQHGLSLHQDDISHTYSLPIVPPQQTHSVLPQQPQPQSQQPTAKMPQWQHSSPLANTQHISTEHSVGLSPLSALNQQILDEITMSVDAFANSEIPQYQELYQYLVQRQEDKKQEQQQQQELQYLFSNPQELELDHQSLLGMLPATENSSHTHSPQTHGEDKDQTINFSTYLQRFER